MQPNHEEAGRGISSAHEADQTHAPHHTSRSFRFGSNISECERRSSQPTKVTPVAKTMVNMSAPLTRRTYSTGGAEITLWALGLCLISNEIRNWTPHCLTPECCQTTSGTG